MPVHNRKWMVPVGALSMLPFASAFAQHGEHMQAMEEQPAHNETAEHEENAEYQESDSETAQEHPPLPEGMTLDFVLDYADNPPPEHFPDPIPDNEIWMFTLIDQLEYRIADDGTDQFGWNAQGWIGLDYDKFWWKTEGDAAFDGTSEGESENDFLYSRLVTPFWNAQVGIQYANAWESGEYTDRWSGVIAFQGLTPGVVELDASFYISDDADVVLALEAEYNVRVTQRLVLQPRTEANLAFQDIPGRSLGTGLTDVNLDLRLRYEITREFAPYVGVRYRFLAGDTADIADVIGNDTEELYLIFGVRLMF